MIVVLADNESAHLLKNQLDK